MQIFSSHLWCMYIMGGKPGHLPCCICAWILRMKRFPQKNLPVNVKLFWLILKACSSQHGSLGRFGKSTDLPFTQGQEDKMRLMSDEKEKHKYGTFFYLYACRWNDPWVQSIRRYVHVPRIPAANLSPLNFWEFVRRKVWSHHDPSSGLYGARCWGGPQISGVAVVIPSR